MSKTTKERLFQNHLSFLVVILGLIVVGISFLIGSLFMDTSGGYVEIKGHLKNFEQISNGRYKLRFEEYYSRIFIVNKLKDLDKNLLALESKNTTFTVTVQKDEFKNDNITTLDVHKLTTSKNTYVTPGNAFVNLKKDLLILIVVGIACLLLALWLLARLRTRLNNNKQDEDMHNFDSMAVFFSFNPFLFLAIIFVVLFAISIFLFSLRSLHINVGVFLFGYLAAYLILRSRLKNMKWVHEIVDFMVAQEESLSKGVATEKPADLQAIQTLLQSPNGINATNNLGQTALHIVAAAGRTEAVNLLLKNGAEINIQDNDGNTPLIIATMKNQLGVVMKLLEIGANTALKNNSEQTALDIATANEKEDLKNVLTKAGTTLPPILIAAKSGDWEKVISLIKNGADVNSHGEAGFTPLMYAVKSDKINIVKTLIDLKADINSTSEEGKSAIQIAEETGNAEMVELMKNPEDEPTEEDSEKEPK